MSDLEEWAEDVNVDFFSSRSGACVLTSRWDTPKSSPSSLACRHPTAGMHNYQFGVAVVRVQMAVAIDPKSWLRPDSTGGRLIPALRST
jgi:hypothetical protein